VWSAQSELSPLLRFDPAPANTEIADVTLFPRSTTPTGEPNLADTFLDFAIAAAGPLPVPTDVNAVGGITGRRVYIRFNLPARLTDSTTILRATLFLTQKPTPTYGFPDTAIVAPRVVIATSTVTDLSKAALITDTLVGQPQTSVFQLPAVGIPPSGSGERRFDIANVARFWLSTTAARVPQAIVLRASDETLSVVEAHFYSMEAAPNLRPRLVITYLPRSEFGIP
jgi:hypothetical protein